MNVLNVIQYYFPGIGGSIRNLRDVSRALSNFGHYVSIFTTTALDNNGLIGIRRGRRPKNLPSQTFDGKVRVVRFRPIILPFLQLYWAPIRLGPTIPQMYLKILKEKIHYDLIQATTLPYAHIYQSYRIANKLRIPYIITPETKPYDAIHYSSYIAKALRGATAIIARTRYERAMLKKYWNLEDNRIHVIGIGVQIDRFSRGEGKRFREKYDIPEDAELLTFVGRLQFPKGFHTFLQTFHTISQKYPMVRYVLCGPLSNHLELAMRDIPKNMREKIILTGPILNDIELADIYSAADIVVYPSRDDVFGTVFWEAWACRKPVIGCPVGSIKAVIRNGIDGFFVRYGDVDELSRKILELMANPDMRKTLGENGFSKVVQGYTVEKIAHKTEELYLNCVQKKR